MRVRLAMAVCVALASAGQVLGQGPAAAEKPIRRGNLVQNPGFAQGLTHWQADPQGGPPPAAPQVDRGVSRGADGGSLALRAETGKRPLVRQAGIARDPRVKKYRFAVWTRGEGLSSDWILRLGVESYKGGVRTRTLQNRHEPCADDPDWQPTILEFEVPEDTSELGVYVGLWFDDRAKASPPQGGGTLWIDDVTLAPVLREESSPPSGPVAIEGLYPLGERGVFVPAQPIELVLRVKNTGPAPAAIEAEVAVKDFFDQPAGQKTFAVQARPAATSEHRLEWPAPERQGFFAVSARVSADGKPLGPLSTGLCVVRPGDGRDPFFGMDPNGPHDDLLGAYRIIGVGSLGIHQSWSLAPDPARDLARYMREQVATRWAAVWKSDFTLVGYVKIDPGFHSREVRAETAARRKMGLFPYPDRLFAELGDAVEAEALAMKGRVRTWVIQEEIDAWAHNPNAPAGSGACELARHVLMTRIACERLKKVDPASTVAAFGVCSDYKGDPPFQLVRSLVPDLKGHFDAIGLDPYCEAYQLGRNRVMGPEHAGFRKVLLDTQKLQAECGKSKALVIAEKGLSVPYHVPPDSVWEKRLANLTARNMIVAKSVQPGLFYSHYLGVSHGILHRMKEEGRVSTDDDPVADFGMWKVTQDGRGAYLYHPRPVVAAFATVAHALAGATEPEEIRGGPGPVGYVFKREGGAVAALWTTDRRPCAVRIALTSAAECCDLMGNARTLPAGAAEVALGQSPVFLTSKASPAALAAAVRKAMPPAQ